MKPKRIREIRHRLGLTAERFGRLLGLEGMDETVQRMVRRYETGERAVPRHIGLIARLSEIIPIETIEYILAQEYGDEHDIAFSRDRILAAAKTRPMDDPASEVFASTAKPDADSPIIAYRYDFNVNLYAAISILATDDRRARQLGIGALYRMMQLEDDAKARLNSVLTKEHVEIVDVDVQIDLRNGPWGATIVRPPVGLTKAPWSGS